MYSIDEQIRIAAFNWLKQQIEIHGDVLSRELLQTGFLFENEKIPLVSPQGIFKPKFMEYPLSIVTTPSGPYDDSFDENGLLIYKYRGTDIHHRDNEGLRGAMRNNLPLIYLHGIVPGKYLVVWPVYIVSDDPSALSFHITVDDLESLTIRTDRVHEADAKRVYLTSIVRVRLHQRGFRERVLRAYQTQCALCRLKHIELLDAAHIIPDGEPDSKPIVNNGISLCKLHHAAFDSFIIGITPDYQVEVREDVLSESDGPMLLHGLKKLHSSNIILPKIKLEWPSKDFLEIRYRRFRKALLQQ